MADPKQVTRRFFGYPKAVEVKAPYEKKADENIPVLQGTILVIGAWLCVIHEPCLIAHALLTISRVSALPFLQKLLWTTAGFGRLRNTENLKKVSERFDVR